MNSKSSGWQNPIPNIINHLYNNGDENGYFMEGGSKLDGPVLSKLDRTITFRIINTGAFTAGAILFGSDGQPDFDPFFGASFISLPDIVDQFGFPGNQSLARREAMGNPFLISGIKMFFPNAVPGTITAQQSEPLRFRNQSITGKTEVLVLQTLNAISPTNANNAYIDMPEAGIEIDPRSDILYNILPGEDVFIYFTVKSKLNSSDFLFSANPRIQTSIAPRPTGNPLYDIVEEYNKEKLFGITHQEVIEGDKDLTPEIPQPVKVELPGTPPTHPADETIPPPMNMPRPRAIIAPEKSEDDCM